MTIKELYRNFLLQLQGIYNLSEATTMTDRVFEKIAGIHRADIIKNPLQPLNPSTIKPLNDALTQLLLHKPLQYVLGETWFYHLKFKVNEQVLIPRPETEELVETVIADLRLKPPGQAILDIGTGSGCIAIAIKKNLPATVVSAIDVSKKALIIAKENATRNNVQVSFFQINFLDEATWDELPSFDMIISNPPYIPENEKGSLARNVVDQEPHLALFVPDNDPLIFYKKIAAFSKSHLNSNGKIYLETHEDRTKEVLALFKNDYPASGIKKDLFGKDRIVIINS